jgi:DNA-binding transcriptional ArsR family regulator
MRELEQQYKALGNRRRLEILKLLKNSDGLSVGDIAQKIKLSIKSTSRHIVVLSSVGAIDKEQVGLNVFCKPAGNLPPVIKQAISLL